MPFQDAFAAVVLVEGGYSDNPADPGGKTRYGITEAVARANGYAGLMDALPVVTAKAIYRAQYWDTLNLDRVDAVFPAVAGILFDTGVNCGTGIANRFLKRALNVLNHGTADWPDLPPDEPIGPKTIYALQRLKAVRGDKGQSVLLKMINDQKGVRYIELAEQRPANEAFEFGWIDKRVQ